MPQVSKGLLPPIARQFHLPLTLHRQINRSERTHQQVIPWIASPVDQSDQGPPHIRQQTEASAIELFYDLFLVGNLSTFTATHEINNLNGKFSSPFHPSGTKGGKQKERKRKQKSRVAR